MKKLNILRKDGIVLITVLGVMVLLLIIAVAIVSLATGNFTTVSSLYAREQALLLANSACMSGIYNLESLSDSNSPWGPGSMPASSLLSFTEPAVDTNGLPGICRVACIDNLNSPHNGSAVGGPSFYPSLAGTEIYGETAVIIGQGEYRGFKRTVKVTVKYTCFSSGGEGVITIDEPGYFMLNGISSIENLDPGPCILYGKKGINYNLHTDRFRAFNGSKLRSGGPITTTGGYGGIIDDDVLEQNHPAVPQFFDWDLGNTSVADPNSYNLLVLPDTETLGAAIKRPQFADPSPDKCYVHEGPLIINNDTFINGSLHIIKGTSDDADLRVYDNANLFINGVLIVDGCLCGDTNGNIYVSGYFNDTTSTDPNCPFGLSLNIKGLENDGVCTTNKTGLGIFAEGDVIIDSAIPLALPDIRPALYAMPEDVSLIKNIFDMVGFSRADAVSSNNWCENSYVDSPPLLYWDATGAHLLNGCDNCNKNLVKEGLKPIPEEFSKWSNHPDTENMRLWAVNSNYQWKWDTFRKNPSLFNSSNDSFLQAVIYTHGTLNLGGTNVLKSIHLLGGVVAKDTPGISPNPDPTDPLQSHGGNINIKSEESCIIYYPEYFKVRSSKFIAEPILNIYSWQEI
jgi:hypothetical protein